MFLFHVTKILRVSGLAGRSLRFAHNDYQYCTQFVVPLLSRKLLKISGKDAPEYLQGLMTNDMRHFEDGARSMYTMFLNNKGRVLYDSLVHKWEGQDQFMIECDKAVSDSLLKHLNMFKLRRKVKLEDISSTYSLWALLSEVNIVPEMEFDPKGPMNIFKDPRLPELGGRIISLLDFKKEQILSAIGQDIYVGDESLYRYVRYKLGVGEGPEDLPQGMCFPLESNCDYLHGVSFHKGCYIGQELTARVYHTGVIRKRLMPIKFSKPVTDFIDKDTILYPSCDKNINIGKLRGVVHDFGLGLVRVKDALESKDLNVRGNTAEVFRPSWWPLEAPKEKITPK